MSIRVVAAVITRADKLLICLRPPHKRHGGTWEFPGGKVEPGETDFEAVRRELAEELGVQVLSVGPVEFSRADAGSSYLIDFLSAEIEGEPVCHEHVELAWVSDDDLASMRLAPADREYAEHRSSRTKQ